MSIDRFARLGVGLALIVVPAISPQSPDPQTATDPRAVVVGFHAALASGDRDGALSRLEPHVVIFETGAAEATRDEYASHHLAADIEFAQAVRTEVLNRQVSSAGEVAWVLTRTRTTGRFREQDVNAVGAETMVLRRTGGEWRIVHIHWSSRPGATQ